MRPRSARFDRVVRDTHRMTSTVDVLYAGQVVASDLAVAGGSVDWDRRAAVLARCRVSLAEPTLIPSPTGPLTPYGYELRVRRGIAFGDGTTELLDLGVFPIQTTSLEGVGLLTTAGAFDRSQRVIDARFEDDYAVAAGVNYSTAIQALIDGGVPGLTYLFPSTSFTTPALSYPMGSDRWEAAREMAAACGWELYFDGLGRCVARTEPSLVGAASQWDVDEGPTGVLVGAALGLDRAPAYNKVVASGENTTLGAVFKGEAADLNPLSPTYYLGGFGRKPRFHVSPLYTSDAQCSQAAAAMLARSSGVARSLRLAAVPQPALEAGDVITVRRVALGVDELHIVDRLSMSLGPDGAMSIDTRTVQ